MRISSLVALVSVSVMLGACASRPILEERLLPDHAVVHQYVGTNETEETIKQAEETARKACQEHGRKVKIPAVGNFCVQRHWYFGTCMMHKYTFECSEG